MDFSIIIIYYRQYKTAGSSKDPAFLSGIHFFPQGLIFNIKDL